MRPGDQLPGAMSNDAPTRRLALGQGCQDRFDLVKDLTILRVCPCEGAPAKKAVIEAFSYHQPSLGLRGIASSGSRPLRNDLWICQARMSRP